MNPNESKPRFTTRSIVNAGLIGAIYVALTLIFQPISFGPMPIANSRTSIFIARAARKCPNSCTVINIASNNNANMIYKLTPSQIIC